MLAWLMAEPIFYGFVLVMFVFNFFSTAFDDDGWYGWSIAITSAAIVMVVLHTPYTTWTDRLALIAGLAIAYLCCGVTWAFKKWIDFIASSRRYAIELYGDDWQKRTKVPTAKQNKMRLTGWMTFWPWSVTWWVLTWPRHAFVWAFNRLSGQFDAIAKRMWN